MWNVLANTSPSSLFLMSIFKPITMMVVLMGWSFIVSKLDKDADAFRLPRYTWNGIQLACGALSFGLWLFLIPFFWLGLLLALLILGAGVIGYWVYRDNLVPQQARWSNSWKSLTSHIDEYKQTQAQRQAHVALMTPDLAKIDVPVPPDPRADAHQIFEQALAFGLARDTDRIDVLAEAHQGLITVHVDGLRYPQPKVDAAVAVKLIDYLKEHARMDVSDRRRKQTSRLRIDSDLGQHALSLTTVGSTREMKLSVRIDPEKRGSIALANLGLLPSQLENLNPVLQSKNGAVIVSSPPGHGQTTTLYSLLREHDPYTESVVTLEEETWFEIEGVDHATIDRGEDAESINQRLRAMMRQDLQVLMLSKVADPSTVRILAKSAAGARLYIGLRHEDTFSCLRAWIKAVKDPQTAADSLSSIISQRLVRKLCQTCRISFTPNAQALRKLNVPPEKVGQLYKESGKVFIDKKKTRTQRCPDCLGMGFRGRVAVFEVMAINDLARDYIAASNLNQLRAHLRKQRMLWLQEAALARVVEGVTSIAEITRSLGRK